MRKIFLFLLFIFLAVGSANAQKWDTQPGEGIDMITNGTTVIIKGEDASASNKGIASFSSDNFATSSGDVSIKDGGVALAEIASGALSGSDSTLITGTAGSNGHCAEWNADGDLVTAGAACGTGGGSGATTSSGGVTYVTSTTDDFAVGSTTSSGAAFFVDVGTGVATVSSTLELGGGTATFKYNTSTGQIDVNKPINVTSGGDAITFSNSGKVTGGTTTDAVIITSSTSAPADGEYENGQWSLWIDAANDEFELKGKDSAGDVISQTIGAASGDVTGVGDCASGACLDGTPDGGTYLRIYDGDSNYVQLDVQSSLASDITLDLPTSAGTIATLADIAGGSDTNAIKTLHWKPTGTSAWESNFAPLVEDDGANIDIVTASHTSSARSTRGVSFDVPDDIDTSGNVEFEVVWYAPVETSGNALWVFQDQGSTAETDSWDAALTDRCATADAVQGTVDLKTVTSWTVSVSTLGWTAGETVSGLFTRDGADTCTGTDTINGVIYATDYKIRIPRS